MESLKSRKFILTVAVLLLSYGLVLANKLEAKQWMDIATLAAGVYISGNVLQKATGK